MSNDRFIAFLVGTATAACFLFTVADIARAQSPRLVVQSGHSNEINDAVFSHDGRFVASAGAEGVAILWESKSGREIRRFSGHGGAVSCIAFSPSGKYIVTGGALSSEDVNAADARNDFSVRLWDAATGIELEKFSGHQKQVTSVNFSPLDENTIVSSSWDGTVRVWKRGARLGRIISRSPNPVNVARFSPDGKIIAVAGGATALYLDEDRQTRKFSISLVSPVTGRLIRSLVGHTKAVGSLVFSSDAKVLISSTLLPATELTVGSSQMRSWQVNTGRLIENLDKFQGPAAFIADGLFLAAGCASDAYDYAVCVLERSPQGSFAKSTFITIPAVDATDDSRLRSGLVSVVAISGTRLLYVRAPVSTGGSGGFVTGRAMMEVYDLGSNEVTRLSGATEGFRNRDPERVRHLNHIDRLRFARDGSSLLSGNALWSNESSRVTNLCAIAEKVIGAVAATDKGEVEENICDAFVALSNSARYAVFSGPTSGKLVDLTTQETIAELSSMGSARFSDDDSLLVTWNGEKVLVINTLTRSQVFTGEFTEPSRSMAGNSWNGFSPNHTDVAITPDGKYLFVQGADQLSRIEIPSGQKSEFGGSATDMPFMAVSPNSKFLAFEHGLSDVETGAGADFSTLSKYPLDDKAVFRFASLKISPDSRRVLVAGDLIGLEGGKHRMIPTLKLVDTASGAELWHLNGPSPDAFVFSADDRYFGTVSSDSKRISIWERSKNVLFRQIDFTDTLVQQITFSPNSDLILVKTEDGATRIFNLQTRVEICRLLSLTSGNWVAVKPDDGRFDTDNFENSKGIHWIMNDRPFEPYPLEIFARQYYEPGLLRRILRCSEQNDCDQEFKKLPSLAQINRVQARVRITGIERLPNSDMVNVAVQVESSSDDGAGNVVDHAKKEKRVSGAYDLRLFRDGQWVGNSTPEESLQNYIAMAPGLAAARGSNVLINTPDDKAWRDANDIFTIKADNVSGQSSDLLLYIFKNIRLPKVGRREIEFSAYAFNSDRVKSDTTRMIYKIAQPQLREGNTYLLTIGVNVTETPAFDLKYAANDARKMQDVLGDRIEAKLKGSTSKLVRIPLVSERKDGKLEQTATKPLVKAVFDLLAGKRESVPADVLGRIPNASAIEPIQPEDTLIITFSGHGYVDRNGLFYLLPYDIGSIIGPLTTETLRRLISSDELSLWMRDVTAKEMVMIVDACHSAAAVQGAGFKPGPMGSRGLGQLAYDKGMKILSATQADNVALELGSLEQGLLSYALLEVGIKAGEADIGNPKDNKLTMTEWLNYAEHGVPQLYQDVIEGRREIIVNGRSVKYKDLDVKARAEVNCGGGKDCPKQGVQRPSLFDFRRDRTSPVLVDLK